MEFEEDKGVFILVDGIDFRSICSRRLLKKREKETSSFSVKYEMY
jgi:hypothetical protein